MVKMHYMYEYPRKDFTRLESGSSAIEFSFVGTNWDGAGCFLLPCFLSVLFSLSLYRLFASFFSSCFYTLKVWQVYMFGKRENDDQQWDFVCFCSFEFRSHPSVGMLECLQIIAFQQRMVLARWRSPPI